MQHVCSCKLDFLPHYLVLCINFSLTVFYSEKKQEKPIDFTRTRDAISQNDFVKPVSLGLFLRSYRSTHLAWLHFLDTAQSFIQWFFMIRQCSISIDFISCIIEYDFSWKLKIHVNKLIKIIGKRPSWWKFSMYALRSDVCFSLLDSIM